MSRKNTILIAVMINISLLTVLFFVATKQKEKELPIDPTGFLVENEMVETAIAQENKEPILEKKEPIVHLLPEAMEEKEAQLKSKEEALTLEKNKEKLEELTVKKGDSLDKIAKAYNVSIDDIVEINQLKTTIIRIGQTLKIPPPSKIVEKDLKLPHAGEYYTVKPGDNPWTIAMKYNIKVESLLKMNSLNKEKAKKLRPGDKLRIR